MGTIPVTGQGRIETVMNRRKMLSLLVGLPFIGSFFHLAQTSKLLKSPKLSKQDVVQLVHEAITEVMDKDIPVESVHMNFQTFYEFVTQLRNRFGSGDGFDPIVDRKTLRTGLHGHVWGIDVYVDRSLTTYKVVALPDSRFIEWQDLTPQVARTMKADSLWVFKSVMDGKLRLGKIMNVQGNRKPVMIHLMVNDSFIHAPVQKYLVLNQVRHLADYAS